ncbi:MAG: MazG nucleotide pyrophosphohydrolase domain-containing protein [Nanoarchaeota archaeon]|nr:MazG nucleotide pyrophosphohydrolase domain-containing protein [Nanoarchaeota archaeon]
MDKEINALLDAVDKNFKNCNWIKEQSPDSYLAELEDEVRELREAIKNKDTENIKEELGDVLWDVISLIKIIERDEKIAAKEIPKAVVDKFKRRKPYIFEGKSVSIEEASKIWQKAKEEEKLNKTKKRAKEENAR